MISLWIAATALRSERRHRESVVQSACRWCDSHRQLIDCLAYGIIELVQLLPVQSSAEGDADISAGQPKFEVIHLVLHLVLGALQTAFDRRKPGDSP